MADTPRMEDMESNDSARSVKGVQGQVRRKSDYRGVCWNKKNKRWQAAINRNGKYIYLGSFLDDRDAAVAFDRAAVKLRGTSAKINFGFADYPEEMSWHKQMTLRGVTPEQLLSDPKLLRTKVEKMHRPYDTVSSMVGVVPSPFHRFPINKHDLSSMYSEAMRPISEPLHGLPIASPRGYQEPINLFPFIQSDDGIISETHIPDMYQQPTERLPCTSNPFEMSDTTGYESSASAGMGFIGGFPLNALPNSCEVAQFYRGSNDSFAIGFENNETSATNVLLYDGRSMHNVGSFNSREDAAQTCRSLLSILDKVKSGESILSPTDNTSQPMESSQMVPSVEIHNALESCSPSEVAELPEGQSPFCIEEGQAPSFLLSKEKEDGLNRCTFSIVSSTPSQLENEAFRAKMGSLIDIDRCFGENVAQPTLPKTQLDTKSPDGNGNSLSINSGSLKDQLVLFNQSLVPRDEDEDTNTELSQMRCIGFIQSEDRQESQNRACTQRLVSRFDPMVHLNGLPVACPNEMMNYDTPFSKRAFAGASMSTPKKRVKIGQEETA